MHNSKLYLVATPIGHLSDITLRAVEILKSVSWIAAEDTRHSQRLLSQYEIHTPVFSLHEHNEDERIRKILDLLSQGKSIALISDAGTPLISDPGFRLVRAVRQAQFSVVPIPGACAAIAGLIASGLPTDRFVFEGFLPAKPAALKAHLTQLKNETRTLVFYESVHRVEKTLQIMQETLGEDRIATIARELTKSFESIKQDTIKNLSAEITQNPDQKKGEFVIVVQGATPSTTEDINTPIGLTELLTQLLTELSVKQAVSLACKITKIKHKTVYGLALQLKNIDSR